MTAERLEKARLYFEMRNIRYWFWRLAEAFPGKARDLQLRMLREEGPEFTNVALDGIVEKSIERRLRK